MSIINGTKKTFLPLRTKMELESIEVIVITPINLTEDVQKVVFAVKNVLPNTEPVISKNNLYIKMNNFDRLRKIKDKIRSKKTLAVLQRILYNNYNMQSTWFLLNKQAAFSDVVVLVENENESPLGPIKITVNGCELERINEWFEK
ncbi:RNA-binding domain-containing protein [Candidatus Nitrosocosmicus sp. T]